MYRYHPSIRIDTWSPGASPGHPLPRERKLAFCHPLYGNHPSTRIDTGSTGISPGHPSCRESKPAFCHIPKEEGRMRAAVSKGLHWISISSSTSESPWRWRCTSRNLGLPPHCPGLSFSHLLTFQAHNQALNSPFSELEFQISEKMGIKIVDVSGFRMLKYLSS